MEHILRKRFVLKYLALFHVMLRQMQYTLPRTVMPSEISAVVNLDHCLLCFCVFSSKKVDFLFELLYFKMFRFSTLPVGPINFSVFMSFEPGFFSIPMTDGQAIVILAVVFYNQLSVVV